MNLIVNRTKMSRPFLFGGNAPNQSSSRYLVEFRAGKMTQNGTTVSRFL